MLFLACPPFSLVPVSGCVRESPRGLVVRFQDPGSVCRPERHGPSSNSAPGPHGMKSAAWPQQNSGAVPPTATDHGVTTDESHFFLIRNSATLSDPFASHSFHPRRPFPASAWGRRRFPVVQANAPRGVSLPQFVGVVQVRMQWASRRGHLPGRSERIWLRHGVLAIGRRLSGRAEGHGGSRVISDALWWQRTGPWNGGAPHSGAGLSPRAARNQLRRRLCSGPRLVAAFRAAFRRSRGKFAVL